MTTTTPSSAALVETIADLVDEHYVVVQRAHRIAEALRDTTPGLPDGQADPAGFARSLTRHLRASSSDRHLSVRHRPDGVQDEQDDATWQLWWAAEARRTAGGIAAVTREQQDVTVVISPSLSPLEHGRHYLDHAMGLVQGSRRMLLDLRACRGGTPDSVAHLCSYLLGERPVHLQDIVPRNGPLERFETTPDRLGAPSQPDLPVAVLTSAATFSGGEDLAYTLQAFGRATVVGETTGGGAHPRRSFVLAPTLELHVPVARSVNARTGSNWERTGVIPDVPCPASDALGRALEGFEALPARPEVGRRPGSSTPSTEES